MAELNDLVAATGELVPGFAIKFCHLPVAVVCPVCGGGFVTSPGFGVSLDAAPQKDGPPAKTGFLCLPCARREAAFLTAAHAAANEGFAAHAAEMAELQRRKKEAEAYKPPPPPPPPAPVRAALQKLEREKMELQGRIKELESRLQEKEKEPGPLGRLASIVTGR